MPRPRSLTPTAIATAALAVIDRDGLAALSMRAVATELGMAPMSLYRYLTDRSELEGMVVDLLLADVDITPPPRAPWARKVAVLVERARDAVGAHPQAVPLTLTHRQAAPSLLRWTESVLRVLTAAGFTGEQRVIALRSLLAYLIGSIQLEHLGPLSGPGTAAIAMLPADEHPLLRETASEARNVPAVEEFRRGLQILLQGLDPAR
ncbi:TetR/AcrR family transcriptional regulator C-terminal domain-containing protein [Pseudonocardia sp.]|jgi:AcrR family transcriptional regulator|uniref:TetR/AcrR family transcriptional regulator n=1 Tax=Pseudonocardia sp. TaxID=60912 RepID=UPI0031FDA1EC